MVTEEHGWGQREVGFSLCAAPLQCIVLNFRGKSVDEVWSKEGQSEARSLS